MVGFNKKRINKGILPSERRALEQAKREQEERKAAKRAEQLEKAEQNPTLLNRLKARSFGFAREHFIWTGIIVVALVGVGKMTWNIVTLAEEFTVKDIVLSAFSEKIQTDEENHTNILLLGTGGGEHDGANLTDTIMVASIDHDQNLVSMLSIPRDLYVEIDELYGGNRINSVFELVSEQYVYESGASEEEAFNYGYEVMMKTVSDMLGIDIHYYARIDFNGFVDLVDALGGIDVVVENSIYDPYYPAENGTDGYRTFSIDQGPQHLDGEIALKYVRSRKTTSDYDRASRQQQVLQAIKEKATSLGVLTNPNKLKDLYDAYADNFDTNLEWDEIVYLAKISSKFERDAVQTWVINDNPLSAGGFLYTPEREAYNGAFVLVPYTHDYSDIQKFADLVLMYPEVYSEPLTYQILNGTNANGVATETMYYLGRFGFDVVRFGNAADGNKSIQTSRAIPLSTLLAGQEPDAAGQLSTVMNEFIHVGQVAGEVPIEYSPAEWTTEADVILELGFDYVEWMNANPQYFY